MGITASMRREPPVENTMQNNVIPPQNSESYFLMFGGPPITGQQFLEQNVFYVQSQRHIPQPVIPPEFKETVTIQNDLNLLKRSLRLTQSTENNKYTLEFEFDSRVPCDVTVHLIAKEFVDKNNNRNIFKSSVTFKKKFYEAASGNEFKESNIDLSAYSALQLTTDTSATFEYPLVIELRSRDANSCQFTYALFSQTSSGGYNIKFLKQKIIIDGQPYELADIFGFDQQGDGHTHEASEKPNSPNDMVMNIEDVDPDDSKCVVCITDQADTAVLPCRHMCMCHGCAKILRLQTNKCPICRTQIENLIVLENIEPIEIVTEGGEQKDQVEAVDNKEEDVDDKDAEEEDKDEEEEQEGIEIEPGNNNKKKKKKKKHVEEKEPLVEDANTSSSSSTQEI